MKKRLLRVGNSYAVVIDKPIRRLLGIASRTILEVSSDGQRIIIDVTRDLLQDDELDHAQQILHQGRRVAPPLVAAARAAATRRALYAEAPQVWLELERRWGITQSHLERLHHDPKPRFVRVAAWMRSRSDATEAANAATDFEVATITRFKMCRDLLRTGIKWDAAIIEAIRAVPKTLAPASSVSAGTKGGPTASNVNPGTECGPTTSNVTARAACSPTIPAEGGPTISTESDLMIRAERPSEDLDL
jgi:bifunctional DNA-binding transcriptional regulator/antitoxin component of YhaV-PrlF toxin-antitoxin module